MNGHRLAFFRAARWSLLLIAGLLILLSACSGPLGRGGGTPAASPSAPPAVSPTSPPETPVVPQTGAEPGAEAGSEGCPPTAPEMRIADALILGPVNGAPASENEGERLVVTGTVYDLNCTPVPGMVLRFWQTDSQGVYGPQQDGELLCCHYGGELVTDAQGRYTIVTVVPGPYSGEASPPPAHIHVEGEHPSGARLLGSEIVFEGDPYLRGGGGYTNPPPIVLQEGSDEQGPYRLGAADLRLDEEVAGGPAAAQPAADGGLAFRILPGESSASYQIREKFADIAEMVSPLGVTGGVEGEIRLSLGEPPALERLEVRVDLTGLKTDDPQRDEKLWDRWLVTSEYPTATFTSTGIQDGPDVYQPGQPVSFTLSGDLTIRDVTRPVEFAVTAVMDGDRLTGEAETKILMTDFGIDPPNLFGFVKVEDEVTVRVDLAAERVEP